MRDVRVVFYMYIDAQQIFCELVVQHTCADWNQKTIWIPHRATRRVLRTPRFKLLNRKGNPHNFLVGWSSWRLPFFLFNHHQWSFARRHSHLSSLLLSRLIDWKPRIKKHNIIILYNNIIRCYYTYIPTGNHKCYMYIGTHINTNWKIIIYI